MPGIGMGAVGAAGAVGVDGAATGERSDTRAPLGAVAILGNGRPSEARRVKSGRPSKLARHLRAEVLVRLRLVSRLAHRARVSVSRSRKARPTASCAAPELCTPCDFLEVAVMDLAPSPVQSITKDRREVIE